ncbi:DNA mismatch repair protein Msh6-1 [Hordeum vulgare]|nr:DNA mismatch repair protein Msh6-1 [Hordeum vulgare]
MLRMDDSEDEEKERNLGKPEGTKKGKQRVKMEGEASSLREKMEQMMKAREELTRKTLETKILITEKKKEVKLAQVEAKREEAKRKADLEERMIKVKEAKVWKELMVEEKEHMMMSKKDMDQEQLQWWKDYKEDIAERKRIFRGASSTLRVDTPMSGGGDGGVEDSTTGDNGGARALKQGQQAGRGTAAEAGGLRSTTVVVEVGRGGEWCGSGLGIARVDQGRRDALERRNGGSERGEVRPRRRVG